MPNTPQQPEWFANWFNSPYYHKLYQHRNDTEAQQFIDNLIHFFKPKPSTQMLDLACGRGRHTFYLHQLGYAATGVDLAPDSIAYARQKATNGQPHFDVHDIRQVYAPEAFDWVLNLFTSFGYFETDAEHQQALHATAANLRAGGLLVIDFLNAKKVIANMVAAEEKQLQGTHFSIKRRLSPSGHIEKNIRFANEAGQAMEFTERVRAYTQSDFAQMLQEAGLVQTHLFGNYNLDPYDSTTADRLIVVGQKQP